MNETYLVIIILIIIIFIYFNSDVGMITYHVPGKTEAYMISDKYSDKDDAVKLLSHTNDKLVELLRHLKKKYVPNQYDGTVEVDNYALRKIVDSMLYNYNPEVIIENTPGNGDTSYTINKGKKLYVCIRDIRTHKLLEPTIVVFVAIHELAHIGHYYGWGHGDSYWEVFKFLLFEAETAGIFVAPNYKIMPKNYCGLHVNYHPLYDTRSRNIWEIPPEQVAK